MLFFFSSFLTRRLVLFIRGVVWWWVGGCWGCGCICAQISGLLIMYWLFPHLFESPTGFWKNVKLELLKPWSSASPAASDSYVRYRSLYLRKTSGLEFVGGTVRCGWPCPGWRETPWSGSSRPCHTTAAATCLLIVRSYHRSLLLQRDPLQNDEGFEAPECYRPLPPLFAYA